MSNERTRRHPLDHCPERDELETTGSAPYVDLGGACSSQLGLGERPLSPHGRAERARSYAVATKGTTVGRSSRVGEATADQGSTLTAMLEAAFIVLPVLTVAGLLIVWSQTRRGR